MKKINTEYIAMTFFFTALVIGFFTSISIKEQNEAKEMTTALNKGYQECAVTINGTVKTLWVKDCKETLEIYNKDK